MDTDHRGNPANFSFQKNNSSGILLGSTANHSQIPNQPLYNSFFVGSQQPAGYGYQQPPTFLYRERKGKVNWRNISNLDIDDIIGRGDTRALETYLSNITFANIEREDLEKFGDATLLKLFRLSQYGLEYLLNTQNYLANQAYMLDNQYKHSEDKLKPIEELARRNHAEITNLKSEVKQKKDLIKTYKKALNKPVFKCHLCSKYFQSSDFLDAHFKRKHPKSPEAEKEKVIIVKEIVKEVATSPLPQKESNVKAAGRYKKSYNEDEELEHQRRNETTGVQTSSTADNTMQIQSSVFLERLMHQFKEDEDMKLSQLNLTIQEKLQEIIRSNKELTSKVADMEKKLENQSFVSPVKEVRDVREPETFQRTIRTADVMRRPQEESINELQRRETPKKPILKSHHDIDDGSSGKDTVVVSEDLDQVSLRGSKPYRSGELKQNIQPIREEVRENPQAFQRQIPQENQVAVFKMQEVQESQRKGDVKVHSLEHIPEEKRPITPQVEKFNQPQISESPTKITRQQFHASSLKDVPEEKQKEQNVVMRSSELKKDKQVFRSGDLEDLKDEEDLFKTSKISNNNAPVKRKADLQVFRSGALETLEDVDDVKKHAGVNILNSRLLEDDDDSQIINKSRKRSQEDFVIMEKYDEEDEEVYGTSPDDIREKHKNLVKKADNAIKSKYLRDYSKQEEQEAKKHIENQMNNICEKKFGIPADQLQNQRPV